MFSLLFLIGQLRSKEAWSITNDQWQAMKNAESLTDFLRQTKDTLYLDAAENAQSFDTFEAKLYKQLQSLKHECFGLRSTPFDKILWYKYDIHNIKILLKTKINKQDLKKYLLSLGTIPLKELEAHILNNEQSATISVANQKLISEAEEVFNESKELAKMDEFLDKEFLAIILKEAKAIGGITQKTVQAMVKDGYFRLELLASQTDIPNEFSSVGLFEKNLDDELSKPLFAEKYYNRGIAPVLLFFRGIEMEIKNLKILYLAHAKRLPSLLNYLRKTYAV